MTGTEHVRRLAEECAEGISTEYGYYDVFCACQTYSVYLRGLIKANEIEVLPSITSKPTKLWPDEVTNAISVWRSTLKG